MDQKSGSSSSSKKGIIREYCLLRITAVSYKSNIHKRLDFVGFWHVGLVCSSLT